MHQQPGSGRMLDTSQTSCMWGEQGAGLSETCCYKGVPGRVQETCVGEATGAFLDARKKRVWERLQRRFRTRARDMCRRSYRGFRGRAKETVGEATGAFMDARKGLCGRSYRGVPGRAKGTVWQKIQGRSWTRSRDLSGRGFKDLLARQHVDVIIFVGSS